MFFLLRSAFWLMIVFALLPALPKGGAEATGANTPPATVGSSINPVEALAAAGAAVSDAGSFCSRQPQACAIGAVIIDTVAEHAEEGARLALSYVGEQIASEKRKLVERALPRPASSTLTIEDLAPDWQGLPGSGAHDRPAVPSALVPLPPKRPA